jgi:hypothetical protein
LVRRWPRIVEGARCGLASYGRLLSSERTTLRKARKAHIGEREHLINMREPFDELGWLNVLN